ncbi:MAG: type II toxin-antitoxin system Phd/YefM family antitoxin [Holosporales bacterium]|jgi:PHD/YefM family antitoxin component YafN of YafNO toxin-antitoxin module|nr:type II toxin-antitoxin system Phd/YefM family antitoxin [Holosporales bacterium]
MKTVCSTTFRKDLFNFLKKAVRCNEVFNISSKAGSTVLMSEDSYNSLMETVYLNSIPGMAEKILDGIQTPIEDCVTYDESMWEEERVQNHSNQAGSKRP